VEDVRDGHLHDIQVQVQHVGARVVVGQDRLLIHILTEVQARVRLARLDELGLGHRLARRSLREDVLLRDGAAHGAHDAPLIGISLLERLVHRDVRTADARRKAEVVVVSKGVLGTVVHVVV